MSSTALVNVARWSALVAGIGYGFSRQQSLTLHVKQLNEETEFRAYADLVEEAKIAFEAAYNREQAAKAAPLGIVIDSDSYRFDGEKWVNFATQDDEVAVPKKKK